jgi:hypothetical protein
MFVARVGAAAASTAADRTRAATAAGTEDRRLRLSLPAEATGAFVSNICSRIAFSLIEPRCACKGVTCSCGSLLRANTPESGCAPALSPFCTLRWSCILHDM